LFGWEDEIGCCNAEDFNRKCEAIENIIPFKSQYITTKINVTNLQNDPFYKIF
jgi:hypothetical protein